MKKILFTATLGLMCCGAVAQTAQRPAVDKLVSGIEPKIIEWRRHFHQYPELSNREVKTAAKIAEELKKMGLEVQTGIAHHGVVGILKGDKAGAVVALRADIDGLPVTERANIPFASKEKGQYNGQEVGIMHACGHDTHTAILLATAEVLSKMKKDIKGTVKFIFQPAEEGVPEGEEGGAELMVKQGVLKNPDAEVIFGLHINSQTPVGTIKYKTEGIMAAVDFLDITVKGKQTHGAYPWDGIDPIVVSSQIINGLQTIVSRQTELIREPAVITIGAIHGGVRFNIIPEEVKMMGTIRSLDEEMRLQIHEKIKLTATKIAESAGATAEVKIRKQYPVTFNHPELTMQSIASLEAAAGKGNVVLTKAVTGAEDFSFYQKEVKGLFFFLGGMSKDKKPNEVAPHHTPDFVIDESGLALGVKAFCYLTLDYMDKKAK
jgi:amidohydrolase